MLTLITPVVAAVLAVAPARAQPVGELHRSVAAPGAALRDAAQRPELRLTLWYPAAADAVETPLTIGPPGDPLFVVGSAAAGAAFAPDGRHPLILLSHGFGGSARIMGWFGIGLARRGYVVAAVDHPGNTSPGGMTVAGAALWWQRADDLHAALKGVATDAVIAPHLDLARLGVAGFSAGGGTALLAAGARVDLAHCVRFCRANPDDPVCRPQREFTVTREDREALFRRPDVAAARAQAGEDRALPGLRAAFAMAPGPVQALDPASLEALHVPVEIMLGDADRVVPPDSNGRAAAALIPGAVLQVLPGVGHDDFLADCTASGRAREPACNALLPQAPTHLRAIEAADAFFRRQFAAGKTE